MKHQTFARFFYLQARIGVARFFSALILACLFAVPISAQTNPKISVQGTLKSSNGATVADGTYAVTFNLYDVPTGGTVLWFEDAMVEVLGGIYTHYLGANKPLVAGQFNKTLYLGVKVNNYELVPRTEFSYAPYAFSVAFAQSALSAEKVVCSGAVGDVKYSILNPTDFAKENGDCWVPMDGRSLAGSKLATHSSSYNQANLPDAGGMFFRAQEFSNSPNNDPDRTPGSSIATVQADDFKSHNHGAILDRYISSVETRINPTHYQTGKVDLPANGWLSSVPVPTQATYLWTGDNDQNGGDTFGIDFYSNSTDRSTSNAGHTETRPKNLNLWVYIRIN